MKFVGQRFKGAAEMGISGYSGFRVCGVRLLAVGESPV